MCKWQIGYEDIFCGKGEAAYVLYKNDQGKTYKTNFLT